MIAISDGWMDGWMQMMDTQYMSPLMQEGLKQCCCCGCCIDDARLFIQVAIVDVFEHLSASAHISLSSFKLFIFRHQPHLQSTRIHLLHLPRCDGQYDNLCTVVKALVQLLHHMYPIFGLNSLIAKSSITMSTTNSPNIVLRQSAGTKQCKPPPQNG